MSQSPIFIKTEAFIPWLLNHTRKFPQSERYRLGKRIEDALFSFHECLIRAALSQSPTQHLQAANAELTKLRAYLRIAVELRYTSPDQLAYATEKLAEIGQLLGGWLKKA